MTAVFSDINKGYVEIARFVKENTSAVQPLSVGEIYILLGDKAKSEAQVRDWVRKHYQTSKLARIREGQAYKYWIRGNVELPAPAKLVIPKILEIPEITVNSKENRVSIKTSSCRITIEY